MAYVPIYMFSDSHSDLQYNCTRVVGETYKCIPIEHVTTAGEWALLAIVIAAVILLLLWVALQT